MRIDLYTKSVLSIIAACLVWLCFGALTPTASAQASAQRVVVAGWDRPIQVVVVDGNGTPLIGNQGLRVNFGAQPVPVSFGAQPLPVTFGNQPVPVALTAIQQRAESWQSIPVALTAIQRNGNWQPILVDVMKQPSTLMPTP
jgi:hypothetical protein